MGSSKVFNYSTTPGSNTSAPPDGAPEGMAADQYNNTMREMMANSALLLRDFPWLELFRAYTLSKQSASSVRIASVDVTAIVTTYRRIQIIGDSTVYGWILSATFSSHTDVTVAIDDGGSVPDNVTKIAVSVTDVLAFPDPLIVDSPCANPGLEIWRLGTTITSATPYTNGDGEYTADQIILLSDGADVVDCSQNSSVVPSDARYSFQAEIETANKKFALYEPFKAADTFKYRGKNVSFAVDLRVSGSSFGSNSIVLALLQWTSTADSFTIDWVSTWNASGTNPTLVSNWAYAGTPVAFTPTSSFVRLKLENIPISASANNLAWAIIVNDATLTVNDDLYWSKPQIDLGPRCLAFRPIREDESERRCSHFLHATFRRNVAPADNLNNFSDALICNTTAEGAPGFSWDFPPMRAQPSVSTFNVRTAGTTGRIAANDGTTDLANTRATDVSERHCRIDSTNTAAGSNNRAYVAAMADARMGV